MIDEKKTAPETIAVAGPIVSQAAPATPEAAPAAAPEAAPIILSQVPAPAPVNTK